MLDQDVTRADLFWAIWAKKFVSRKGTELLRRQLRWWFPHRLLRLGIDGNMAPFAYSISGLPSQTVDPINGSSSWLFSTAVDVPC
jgi:hypothetical protein